MGTWIGPLLVGLLFCCVHGEQAVLQDQLRLDSGDLGAQVRALQQNVTEVWTYIYRLRQAVEAHLTDLTQRQSRTERAMQHFGGHDFHGHDQHTDDHGHGEAGHHHEPLTSRSDHHDDHSSSDHHHDDHGSSDHHHDDHGSSDHHDDHGPSDHHHDDHGSSDQHHDDHHHYSHSDSGDHHHTDEHHGDYHDDHHHGHHSTADSHTDDHSSHNDSDHSKEHGQDDHHHHHGDDSGSAEDQQTVQDVEKPFTVTVVRSHQRDHSVGTTTQNTSDPWNLLGGHSHHHHHHHHHHGQDQQTYDAKVSIPKYSDYRHYTFATCDVQPNRVISTELQQEVKGQVSFWQRKTGGPLNIHVRLRGFAIGDHHGHQQQQEQTNEAPLHGAGHRHGFHVHEFGDLSAGCQSAGAHYNPLSVNHGGPKAPERHVGDLGNIECDDHGVTNIVFADPVASLTGQYSIVGRALVIHSDVDDYGVNKDDPESLTTGNAGTRIACCVIQTVPKLPLTTYKSIKLATNHQP